MQRTPHMNGSVFPTKGHHFEYSLFLATSVMLFGLSSSAALATVVGVLIEVPVMLMLVDFCKRTAGWFKRNTGIGAKNQDRKILLFCVNGGGETN